jgi:hypothetical protein
MPPLKKVGIFLAACSGLCGLIAVERYQLKRRTASTIAEMIGVEMISLEIPLESQVAGFLSVTLLTAAIACWFQKPAAEKIP